MIIYELIYFILLFYMSDVEGIIKSFLKGNKADNPDVRDFTRDLYNDMKFDGKGAIDKINKIKNYLEKLKKNPPQRLTRKKEFRNELKGKVKLISLLKMIREMLTSVELTKTEPQRLKLKDMEETIKSVLLRDMDKILPAGIKANLKSKKMSNMDFVDYLINGGKTKDLLGISKLTPKSSKEDEVRPSSGTTKAAKIETRKFRDDVERLQDFVFEYKTLNGISKQINLGSKLRKIIIDYLPEGDRKKKLLRIVRRLMDSLIPDDNGSSQFSRSLPESLMRRLKKKDMSPINFVNFLINGGKQKDLKIPKKKEEKRPATKPASTKEDEVRPSSGTTSAKKDKPKKKYDKPPAYCFTKKRDDGQKYVVCVPSFI